MDKLYKKLATKTEQINKLTEELKEIKSEIMENMKNEGIDSYMSSKGTISYIPQSISYTFDSTQFKKDEKELYEKYMTKERVVSEQIRISQRKP